MLAQLEAHTKPIALPSVAALTDLALDLDARIAQDVVTGREVLRGLLADGRLSAEHQAAGTRRVRGASAADAATRS